MKTKPTWTTALVIAAAIALVGGCGVGNDEDERGSLTPFNVQPTEITVSSGTAGACPGAGPLTRVFVYGGTAPYQVDSTLPAIVGVSSTRVEHPGGFFDISMLQGACLDNISVIVTDKWGRQQIVRVNAEAGTAGP